MKYEGRITISGFTASIGLFHLIFEHNFTRDISIFEIVFTIIIMVISWYIGMQYDKFKYYAEKDELTNLYNRRFVFNIFPKISSLTSRLDQNLFALLIDCNHFKVLNDTYGHNIGDKVLQCISDVLIQSSRDSDIVARWGGDEFLVIGYCKNKKDTKIIIARIYDEIEKIANDISLDISISIGLAIYKKGQTIDELIENADKHMYRIKRKTTSKI